MKRPMEWEPESRPKVPRLGDSAEAEQTPKGRTFFAICRVAGKDVWLHPMVSSQYVKSRAPLSTGVVAFVLFNSSCEPLTSTAPGMIEVAKRTPPHFCAQLTQGHNRLEPNRVQNVPLLFFCFFFFVGLSILVLFVFSGGLQSTKLIASPIQKSILRPLPRIQVSWKFDQEVVRLTLQVPHGQLSHNQNPGK